MTRTAGSRTTPLRRTNHRVPSRQPMRAPSTQWAATPRTRRTPRRAHRVRLLPRRVLHPRDRSLRVRSLQVCLRIRRLRLPRPRRAPVPPLHARRLRPPRAHRPRALLLRTRRPCVASVRPLLRALLQQSRQPSASTPGLRERRVRLPRRRLPRRLQTQRRPRPPTRRRRRPPPQPRLPTGSRPRVRSTRTARALLRTAIAKVPTPVRTMPRRARRGHGWTSILQGL